MSARRTPARSRRVDDALSQLVDSLLPPLSPSALLGDDDDDDDDDEVDREDALAAAEEQRLQRHLSRAWRILDSVGAEQSRTRTRVDGVAPPGRGGTTATTGTGTAEDINNASDLIKRKLLRENASPDKAVRFSNLYSRLLTQPVLGQKWAILYLLYRLSENGDDEAEGREEYEEEDDDDDDDEEKKREIDRNGGRRSRSPLLDDGNLDNILFKSRAGLRGAILDDADEGPAISSSVSQRGNPLEGRRSERNPERVAERQRRSHQTAVPDEVRETTSSAHVRGDSIARDNSTPKTAGPTESTIEKTAESSLLRDLPFILQGLSSTNIEFTSTTMLKLPTNLPIPMISLLHTLAEPCLLYKELSGFVDGADGGLVSQALRAAIFDELRSYLGLIATLEGEIRRALTAAASDDPKGNINGAVTLKRCVVWTRDATMALRLMSIMVEEARDKRGGQLISLIHGFSSSHGDPFVGNFAEKLLSRITRPFYDILRQWIYDGELSDPYKEFFVIETESRPSADPRRIASSVWEDKYKLDEEMIPSFITQDFAKKVFLIGKSLNFIRYGCGDSAWVEAYSKETSKELRYGDTARLENSIDEAYKTTMARLIYLMDTKFKLFEHLRALKKYLLLGQGDFIALLMESLASNLDRPANSQYRHTLTAQLEHAIRSSNAQFDSPDVLRRLDARMLELSHGEIGWDCFTLEYKIDAPVDVVITPWGSTQYLKVFNFLWRVKRVEFALESTWRRFMTGARGVLGSVDDRVGADWKRARCVIAEMIHFVCQLQYYILFEVIEASWDQLQAAISKPGCTLDDLIEAHSKYLNSITHKGLLGSSTSSSRSSSSTAAAAAAAAKQPEESFLAQLHQILKIMLNYKDAVDGLYSFSVAEFTRRQELSAKIETRTAHGQWGVTEQDLNKSNRLGPFPSSSHSQIANQSTADDQMLASLQSRLQDLSADFRARLNVLLGDLAYQPDVDMRFLGVVMNFNDVYEPARRRRTAAAATATTSSSVRDRERERRSRRTPAVQPNNAGGGGATETKESSGDAK